MSTGEGCVDPDGPGPLEVGDGQFSKPEHVSTDSQGNIYVVDRGNKESKFLFHLQINQSKYIWIVDKLKS